MKRNIAVIGTGRMGSALAKAFLAGGHRTSVWNRTQAKLQPLAAAGAQVARSVREAISDADVVIVNLSDYAASNLALRSPEAALGLKGKLLVQLTSGSPQEARESAAWASQHGIDYLDGAIMATPDLIGGTDSSILYSGPAELFARYQPDLLALGGHAAHVGEDVGHASALDSALLIVMWGALFGMLHGVSICRAENLPLGNYASHLEPFARLIGAWVMDGANRIHDGRLAADSQTLASIGVHYGAFRCLLALCKERNISSTLPEAMNGVFHAAVAAGHAQDDFAALSAFVR
jgi:3-hydroxyisobutyrate dehydrogenase-like beta-hydroxyacid dehydrogenase